MMSPILALHLALLNLSDQARTGMDRRRELLARDREAGALTLEQVMITLGLLLAATAAVAVITLAIKNRTDQIT